MKTEIDRLIISYFTSKDLLVNEYEIFLHIERSILKAYQRIWNTSFLSLHNCTFIGATKVSSS